MPIGKVWIYGLLFVFRVFVRLRISPASGVKFCTVVQGVLGRKSPILGNFAPHKPKIERIGHPPGGKVQGGKSSRNRVPINIARRVDVGSACVDIRPSSKTDVLVPCFVCIGVMYVQSDVHETRPINDNDSSC